MWVTVVCSSDITAKVIPVNKKNYEALEKKLIQSTIKVKEYADILDILPDIIYKIDPNGNFVYLSKSVSILGYQPEDLIGKHFSSIIHPSDLPHVSRDAVLKKYRGKETGAENAPKLFDERRTGNRVTRNLVIRLLSKVDRDQIEKSQTASNGFHGEVMATGQYGSHPGAEARGHNRSFASADEIKSFYAQIATFGKYDKDINNPDKKFQGTVGIIRDISERKRLERIKQDLEHQLFHSKKMQAIGELAGGIAHDFNNLLGIMTGYIEMLKRKFMPKNPRMEKYLGTILTAIDQAADLTKKLLAFGRKDKEKSITIDLHEIILDVTQLLKHSFDKKIAIRYSLNAEESYVTADPGQIKNALLNIAINARDAMPEGGSLRFSTTDVVLDEERLFVYNKHLSENHFIKLSIEDTGCGMDPETKERLFEPFFTTKTMGKGTGLGLACVYGIVEMHNGIIEVESAQGKGTTFNIFLPLVYNVEHDKTDDLLQSVEATEGQGTVLIIDDEELMLEVNIEMLTYLGFQTKAFDNGKDAISWYRKNYETITFAIIDMIMPDLNGKETFRELKSINSDLCAIISTGYSYEHEADTLIQEGISGFIQKPFNSQKLMEAIQSATKNRQ